MASWTKCIQLSHLKVCVFLHLVAIVTSTSSSPQPNRLRLKVTEAELAKMALEHSKDVKSQLAKAPSGKIRNSRHLGATANTAFDTPSVRMKAYMFCRTGFLLEIGRHGRITGTTNLTSTNALLEIQIFDKSKRRVKGEASGRYLSINSRGRLTSTLSRNKHTFFKENLEENSWFSYSSMHLGQHCGSALPATTLQEWFIAIKENGYLRRPCKTLPGMAATHFFVLRPEKIQDLLEMNYS